MCDKLLQVHILNDIRAVSIGAYWIEYFVELKPLVLYTEADTEALLTATHIVQWAKVDTISSIESPIVPDEVSSSDWAV